MKAVSSVSRYGHRRKYAEFRTSRMLVLLRQIDGRIGMIFQGLLDQLAPGAAAVVDDLVARNERAVP